MQKNIKCLISILLSLVIMTSLAMSVCAVEPRFSDTNSVTVSLTLSGTTAYCSVKIHGAEGTSSITDVNITLKNSNNGIVAKWSDLSSDSSDFYFFDTVTDLKEGETYTLSVTAKVNRNGKTEPVSGSKTKP